MSSTWLLQRRSRPRDGRNKEAVLGDQLLGHALYAGTVVVITACCIAISQFVPSSWGGETTWLLVAPAMGLLFGTIPAYLVRRRSDRAEKRSGEQDDVISLLLKDYAADRGDWIWSCDVEGRLVGISEKFAIQAGQPAARLEGQSFANFLSEVAVPGGQVQDEIVMAMRQRRPFFDLELRVKIGLDLRRWRLAGKPVFREGRFTGYLGTASDITTEVQARETMSYLAYRDGLTGLANRSHFTQRLNECVARLERYGTAFSVLYLDLDKFKNVNDSRGHHTGDRLLVEVGKRFAALVRDTDLVARLGGDEFAMILAHDSDTAAIATLANRLVTEIGKPFTIDGEDLSIGLSLGIAIAPINGTRPDQILRNADLALYRAKGEGGSRFCFFESRMDSEVRERRMLELEMAEALENGEFQLFYQPVVDARTHAVSGYEALIRWNHPIRGLVPPSEFVPIAEQSSLIVKIGEWTIGEACRMLARLPEHHTVAVNLSTKHFRSADIAGVVTTALRDANVEPHRLEVEITESLLIENADEMAEKMRDLKRAGINIAMDDFGTGYSSLSYLLKFPFDKIKIDRAFVAASGEGFAAREILRSILGLAQRLDIRVTSEGVETLEQAMLLAEFGSTLLQGYHFARPMPEDRLADWLGQQATVLPPEGRIVLPDGFLPPASKEMAA